MLRSSSYKLAFFLLFGGASVVSQGATIQDARLQYQAGKLKPALEETNALLKTNPDSIPALFLKAQIESENRQLAKAIETYQHLIALDSSHLQAYNNLAALYAQQGKLALASETLEQAIRTDPVYTTIHTNLRAIYMDMSKKHYRQALKLKPEANRTQIASIDYGNTADQILNQAVPSATPKKPEPPKTVKIAQAAKKETTPKLAPPEKKTIVAEPVQKARKQKTATKTASKPKPKPKSKKDIAHEVKKSLLSWANAWSNRDAKRYVSAYVKNYAPAGKSNADWAAGRRWNFKNKKYIKVTLSNIRIEADGKHYRASFKQRYESNSYNDEVNKEAIFVQQDGRWKIKQESTK